MRRRSRGMRSYRNTKRKRLRNYYSDRGGVRL